MNSTTNTSTPRTPETNDTVLGETSSQRPRPQRSYRRSLLLAAAVLLLGAAPMLASGCMVHSPGYRSYRVRRVPQRVCRMVRTVRYRTVYRFGVPYRQKIVRRHRKCRRVYRTVRVYR
jgi:hypothetical protein